MLTSKHMLSLLAKCYLMAARLEPFGIMASIHHNNDYHLIANVHFWIACAPLRKKSPRSIPLDQTSALILKQLSSISPVPATDSIRPPKNISPSLDGVQLS
ncbi:uncharacterized protein NPIL_493891 [Nephila pilipes]|uniref:Uncharacterized protein n=1 Tax=Nephila pilipes TaxID=299642 RepID=A0A8X6Q382_NEPPI|nr:uncharacterized protein NPIL_493891 [Nephila pilipes]